MSAGVNLPTEPSVKADTSENVHFVDFSTLFIRTALLSGKIRMVDDDCFVRYSVKSCYFRC